jgi:hypothetical protein
VIVPQQEADKQQHFIVSYNGIIHMRWGAAAWYCSLPAVRQLQRWCAGHVSLDSFDAWPASCKQRSQVSCCYCCCCCNAQGW